CVSGPSLPPFAPITLKPIAVESECARLFLQKLCGWRRPVCAPHFLPVVTKLDEMPRFGLRDATPWIAPANASWKSPDGADLCDKRSRRYGVFSQKPVL